MSSMLEEAANQCALILGDQGPGKAAPMKDKLFYGAIIGAAVATIGLCLYNHAREKSWQQKTSESKTATPITR